MPPPAILETVLYAADPDACADFYIRLFGFADQRRVKGRFAFLRGETQMLLIFNPGPSSDPARQSGIPAHGAHGPGHICFRAEGPGDLARWRARLTSLAIPLEHEHDWPGGGRSLYLRDPAGNSVEIAEARIWGLE
ncbi:VOC family protein [Rhodobacteraceae bacterium HSP-20]|uniref:VOC family protein n=1 Tax=Paragemmobacter amnigenus TaxID=2852097 RepID=A0ABS6J0S5_9RHOB|nr:VOC family protein [Rhodobacter amnigenus]MBU9697361.1 VOC family protein [Rhodobacter amnigenus]MBV4388588.1 VOC family protein [Rhodobacter amnigenus]